MNDHHVKQAEVHLLDRSGTNHQETTTTAVIDQTRTHRMQFVIGPIEIAARISAIAITAVTNGLAISQTKTLNQIINKGLSPPLTDPPAR